MSKLIVYCEGNCQEYKLGAFNTIGRHPDNSIQILDRILSKEHAHIIRQPDGSFLFKDLGSLNGSYCRGTRITEMLLRDGEQIKMGSTNIVFQREKKATKLLDRVTIIPGTSENLIRQRITADDGSFSCEKDIADNQTLREDYERLRIGHELAKAVGAELDLDKLLPKILNKAFELVGADRGVLLLMEPSGELAPHYIKNKTGEEESIALSKTVMAEVIEKRTALLSSDVSMDDRLVGAHSIIMQGIRSTMTVPLLHADEILGIMHLDSKIASNTFSEKDLQICLAMASQAAIAIQNARLAQRIEQEAQTRAQISRLIPPAVVEQVLKGELTIEKGGQLREITMLFSDIRGFTSMSDGAPPEEVVKTLNAYFEVMVEVLFRHHGTLDKFVGDEIIGLFGAPIDMVDHAYKSVACALDMLRSLKEFNRIRVSESLPPIHIGIGINTGSVITGSIGSTRALQYTAIGDAMNVAARLVNIAKPGELIISEVTYSRVANRIQAEPLPPVKVKGKAKAMNVYRVLGYRDQQWSGATNI